MTPEEYLDLEFSTEGRYEFVDGEMIAMAGGSTRHSLISSNVAATLSTALGGGCLAFNSDLRVCIDRHRFYTYPDATVVCGRLEYLPGRRDTVTNPRVLVEVISPSTRNHDPERDRSPREHRGGFAGERGLP